MPWINRVMTKKMSSKKMNYLLHKELKKVKNEERKLGLIDYLRVILVRQLNLLDQNHQHCLSTMQTMHRVERTIYGGPGSWGKGCGTGLRSNDDINAARRGNDTMSSCGVGRGTYSVLDGNVPVGAVVNDNNMLSWTRDLAMVRVHGSTHSMFPVQRVYLFGMITRITIFWYDMSKMRFK